MNCDIEPDIDTGFVSNVNDSREEQINLQGAFTTQTVAKMSAIQVETLH